MHTLKRTDFTPDGIFGTFTFEGETNPSFVTLEHAYVNETDGTYQPKLPAGQYKCVLGKHELHSGPVTTFEVMDVPGHSGILCCHVGNYNDDSEGCVLVGIERVGNMINNSKLAFHLFMDKIGEVTEYDLEVVNP